VPKKYIQKRKYKKRSSHLSIYITFYHCVIHFGCVLFCSSV